MYKAKRDTDLKNIVQYNINLTEALSIEIEEYENLHDTNIVKYLINLEKDFTI